MVKRPVHRIFQDSTTSSFTLLRVFQPGVNINWENYWTPKIFIENAVGDPKVTQSRMLDFNENGEAWVIDRRRVKGEFIEQLELWEFPFDVQVPALCS